ncbi:MAG: hypothetical protein CSB44_02550 [Gammaproteobacteria bacterium]|nr:MAG: hypothetical protein CSB44_02550 [Gammaproteobacteria bacterium]
MDLIIWLELGLFVILVGLSGFFSSSETALFSLNNFDLEQMKHDDNPNLDLVKRLLSEPRRLIVTILIANEFVIVSSSVISASIIIQLFGPEYSYLNLFVAVPALLLFGEVTPKTLALKHNIAFASVQARPIDLFSRLIFPLRWIIRLIADRLTTMIVGSELKRGNIVTDDMIRTLTHEAESEGVLDHQEAKFVDQIFEFGHKTVGDVMTPRSTICFLSTEMPLREILSTIRATRHVAFPVYRGGKDDVIGVLFAADLLGVGSDHIDDESQPIDAFLRTPYLVPENKPAIELFHTFQNTKRTFALVVDEYGGIVGIVNMKDLLGQIFGRIRSLSSAAAMQNIASIDDQHVFILDGDMGLDDFNREFGVKLKRDGIRSLAGYILNQHGELPAVDTIVETHLGRFCIVEVDNNRIVRLLYSREPDIELSSRMLLAPADTTSNEQGED